MGGRGRGGELRNSVRFGTNDFDRVGDISTVSPISFNRYKKDLDRVHRHPYL